MNILELEAKAEKALNFLEQSDYEHAELRAKQNQYSELRKAIVADGFLSIDTGAQEHKKQAAHATFEYKAHIDLIYQNDLKLFEITNRRNRAVATIDLYRTMSANQRRGN